MDYYVQRYNFPKPDLDFSQSTSRKGSKKGASKWEVALKVDGRVIGMGEGSTKKQAQVKTYLDVTQYLEGCDRALWDDFTNASAKAPMEDIGMAPHLVFQMSDPVSDDVQAITEDIRRSNLYKNAPASGVAAESQTLPTWKSNGKRKATAAELDAKSQRLRDQLDDYYTDPKMDKMRQQRDALPIKTRASDILAKIEMNDVTIIMAATGSGKTTQVPQLLFDDFINRGQGAHCNILCTQPRRLAAMSVADRIADERGQKLGQQVGYQVRFDVKAPEPDGCITFCTTGIFLKRMQSALGATADPESVEQMDKVTHIVVDEVHERDIDTDLSLVVLKRLLADRKKKNKPLKVILMSATIDPTLFKTYFPDARGRSAPVADVPGRTFPVTKFFLDDILQDLRGLRPAEGGWIFQDKLVADYLAHEMQPNPAAFSPTTGMNLAIPYPLVALTIAYVLNRSNDGHVLVFLPGWEEIKKVSNILLDTSSRNSLLGTRFNDSNQYSVHYLHSSIPAAEQKEVFKPPPKGVRRIILATNIAETSITIPDVVYVVDAARVKEKRYDPERHMSSLVAAWVGSSNLNQRAGRAGRHREGEYFGLLSKRRYEALETHQTVEMMRSDLSNVVMHVKALNLGVVEEVMAAVIEPPEPSRIVAAMDSLRMLGALDGEKNLTSLGRVLLQLPVDAAIGKLCLYGSFFRCLDSALTLAAILTNRDPFLAPLEKKREADEIKDSWSPVAFRSDPLAIWAAYNEWAVFEDTGVYYKGNQFCSANFLSKATLMQIKQVKGSLLQSLDQAGVIAVSAGGNVNRIGRRTVVPKELNQNGGSLPLLAALLAMASAPNFALRTSEKTCRTAQDKVSAGGSVLLDD
jgi:HrpA-like RNA helicase